MHKWKNMLMNMWENTEEKKREQGIHEPTVKANTAPYVSNHMYKQNAILC